MSVLFEFLVQLAHGRMPLVFDLATVFNMASMIRQRLLIFGLPTLGPTTVFYTTTAFVYVSAFHIATAFNQASLFLQLLLFLLRSALGLVSVLLEIRVRLAHGQRPVVFYIASGFNQASLTFQRLMSLWRSTFGQTPVFYLHLPAGILHLDSLDLGVEDPTNSFWTSRGRLHRVGADRYLRATGSWLNAGGARHGRCPGCC